MLPTTITLTDGTNSEDFTSPKRTANGQIFASVSPQGDLQGAPTLRVETSTTSKKIERGVIQLQRPVWDAEKQQYVYFNTLNIQVNRHVSIPVADILEDLKKITSIPATVLEELAQATL